MALGSTGEPFEVQRSMFKVSSEPTGLNDWNCLNEWNALATLNIELCTTDDRRLKKMYGWRVRIGHVAPSRGDTLVYEFYQMLPAGFMILNSTGTIRQLVDADLERQLQRIEEAAADLVDNKCDSVIIGGSPLFTKLGYGSDTEMAKRLTEKFGVPVSPGITGEIEALKSLNLKKLVVATPRRYA
jgi:hypothetical protein